MLAEDKEEGSELLIQYPGPQKEADRYTATKNGRAPLRMRILIGGPPS